MRFLRAPRQDGFCCGAVALYRQSGMSVSKSPQGAQLEEAIVRLLAEKAPLKAKDIARELGVSETKPVNAVLYGTLSDRVVQDGKFRWSLQSANSLSPETQKPSRSTDTKPSGAAKLKNSAQAVDQASESAMNELFTEPPSCPECGEPMDLRTAKRGFNKGGKFWGCSAFPSCRGTLDAHVGQTDDRPSAEQLSGESSKPEVAVARPDHSSSRSRPSIARRVTLPGSVRDVNTFVFQSAAAPREVVRAVARVGLDPEFTRSFSQWRLRLPVRDDLTLSDVPTSYAIADKVLRRGSVVPCAIDGLPLPEAESEEWIEALQAASVMLRARFTDDLVPESAEERSFAESLLPDYLGETSPAWLISQVPLASLTGSINDESLNRRVDFLVAHPTGGITVVEVDGEQHHDDAEADRRRDTELRSSGIPVVRVSAAAVRGEDLAAREQATDALCDLVADLGEEDGWNDTDHTRALLWSKRLHQIQIAVVQAVLQGTVDSGSAGFRVAIRGTGLGDEPQRLLEAAVTDLASMLRDLALLYGETAELPVPVAATDEAHADLVLRIGGEKPSGRSGWAMIDDVYLPFDVASPGAALTLGRKRIEEVDRAVCERFLKRIFGFESFRGGQFDAVERALLGKDALVLLPTGAGKSVAFQLPALLRPGVCLVVDPILSLVEDQIENLKTHGIDRVGQITSLLGTEARIEVERLFAQGELLFCYIAPERFQNADFRASIRSLTATTPIAMVVIDEVHCLSEWGHDFRTAYLNLPRIARQYCATDRLAPPLIGLTGTASRSVLKDLQRETGITDFEAIITPPTFDRAELTFELAMSPSDEKQAMLHGMLDRIAAAFRVSPSEFFRPRGGRTAGGLVFCPFVNGDFGVRNVAKSLGDHVQQYVPIYSGSAPRGFDLSRWTEDKRRAAQGFKRDEFSLMVCTKAFGMGIDKPNVRYTVHFGIPTSIESFYQEAGRAGRDGNKAICALLISNDAPSRNARLLDPGLKLEVLRREAQAIPRKDGDDISRALFFHVSAFAGLEDDLEQVATLISELGDVGREANLTIPFLAPGAKVKHKSKFGPDKTPREKAVHRLLTVGIVKDYTVDYPKKQFNLTLGGADRESVLDAVFRYIASYQRDRARVSADRLRRLPETLSLEDFALKAANEILDFVYDVIERSRRQALSEMLAACESADGDPKKFRSRILAYLESSAFSQAIDDIIGGDDAGLHQIVKVLAEVRSALDAAEVRGQVARALEAYPDHPGLRLLRATSEAMSPDSSEQAILENTEAGIGFGTQQYGIDAEVVIESVVQAAEFIAEARPQQARVLVAAMLEVAPDAAYAARRCLSRLPHAVALPAIAVLLNPIADASERLVNT